MSPAPAFKTVVFFDEDAALVFVPDKKGWRQLEGSYSLDKLPDKQLQADIKDGSVLAVVSDAFCGHLQVVVPNKKESYSDENIGQILSEQHIDLSVYEFASQRFPLGREEVQVSVSGIERDVYQKVEAWVSALGAKKFWVMPFGWFVSSLKPVEPALIAVVRTPERVLVSHHYLGVDDARTIPLADLRDYALARKEERKETHLVYIQADADLRRKTTKVMGEEMAVHSLLPEEGANALLAVIESVLAKGAETLGELLHFVGEEPAASKPKKEPAPVAEEKSEEEAVVLPVPDAPSAEELPKPELPAAAEAIAPPAVDEPAARTVVEVEEEPVAPQPEVETAPPAPQLTVVSQLQGSEAIKDNTDRYLEVKQSQSRWKGPILVFLAVAIITGVVGGAVFWSRQVRPPGPPLLPPTTSVTPTPEPTVSPVPTASPAAVLTNAQKRATSILVLNATGIPGLAGQVKSELAEDGWTNVKTGNAQGSYEGATFVYTQKEELIPVLAKDLGFELKRATQVKESQAEDYSVVIILAERLSL